MYFHSHKIESREQRLSQSAARRKEGASYKHYACGGLNSGGKDNCCDNMAVTAVAATAAVTATAGTTAARTASAGDSGGFDCGGPISGGYGNGKDDSGGYDCGGRLDAGSFHDRIGHQSLRCCRGSTATAAVTTTAGIGMCKAVF